jgi:hypothetical protein
MSVSERDRQRGTPCGEAGVDGGRRHPQFGGDDIDREVQQVVEDEHRALRHRKALERSLQIQPLIRVD